MTTRTRWLAVASAGGHWVQLLRLRPAWEGCEVVYMTTNSSYEKEVAARALRFHAVRDASRTHPLALLGQLLHVLWVVVRERPTVVISTGASIGLFALYAGKLIGARTIWVDSIANAEELSLSGKQARRVADLWLTQWPHLAHGDETGRRYPRFAGSVL